MYYDSGVGIYLGLCDGSIGTTSLILNEKGNLIRRNTLACKFDETLLTRYKLGSLQKHFLGEKVNIKELFEENETNIGIDVPDESVSLVTEEAPKYFNDVLNSKHKKEWFAAIVNEHNTLVGMRTYRLVRRDEASSEILP